MPFVSPGVYIREIDLSDYAAAASTTIVGMVGGAKKGPLDVPVLVTNEADLIRFFGTPDPADQGMYAAIHYLSQGNTLWYTRVANTSVATASFMHTVSADDKLEFTAKTPGTWADGMQVTIEPAGTEDGYFNIVVESVIDNAGTVDLVDSIQYVQFSNPNDADYIETKVEDSSWFDLEVIDPTYEPTEALTVTLAGGNDGISGGIDDADYVGTVGPGAPTGMQVFADVERYDINLLAVPGISSTSVVSAMLVLASGRADTLAVIDPPIGLSSTQVVDWHNGTAPYNDHQAYNSSYGALYWSWVQVFDPYNARKVFTAPSGHALAAMALTDSVAFPWYAPAGLTRGRILRALKLEHSPSPGERDILYGNQNAVNPIVNFSKDGVTIWGQRTLQRRPTALDRVNTRRMLSYAEKVIATSVKYLNFEPNDPATQQRFVDMVTPHLEAIKSTRGLTDFKVICDASTNPPNLVDRNELNGKLFIKPTKTAEIIVVDFVLLASGASFSS